MAAYLLALLALLCACVPRSASGLAFSVSASSKRCMFQPAASGQRITLHYRVTAGGFLDINLQVLGPSGSLLHSQERASKDEVVLLAADTGDYQFCFDNSMSTVTTKTVDLKVKVEDVKEEAARLDGALGGKQGHVHMAKKAHLLTLSASLEALRKDLETMRAEQKYMRQRERAHTRTTDSTHTRVLWWSCSEAAALGLVSVVQIWYLKRHFEVRRSDI